MTSRERWLRLLRGESVDRIAISIRGVRSWKPDWVAACHPTFRPLIEAVQTHADWIAPIGFEAGFCYTMAPLRLNRFSEETPGHPEVERRVTIIEAPRGPLRQTIAYHRTQHLPMTLEHFVKTPDDLENLLAIPYLPPRPQIAPILDLDRRIGDRGLVMVGIGLDPIGELYDLLGTETLAFWSFEHRDLLHRALAEFTRRRLDLVHHFRRAGLHDAMPMLYGYAGPEVVVPPLHPPGDFRDFCRQYNQPLHQLMHEAGAFVHVHCHGSINQLLEDFVEMGTDLLHPVEAPPMGDTPLPEAKRRIGDKLVIEGNVQIAELLDEEPAAFRRRVEQAVAEGKPGGRFAICPTASPYPVALSDRTVTNYLAMIEIAQRDGRY